MAALLQVRLRALSEREVSLPLPPQSTTTAETRFESGLAVQKRILGDAIERLFVMLVARRRLRTTARV